MVQYIKQLAEDLRQMNERKFGINFGELVSTIAAINEELARLDPRDFLPDAQYRFVKIRILLKTVYKDLLHPKNKSQELVGFPPRHGDEIIYCLDQYTGEGSRAETREFTFISDVDLRSIIQRDYKELSLILLPGGAWKSCVVMAGSILEAILYDVLTRDAVIKSKAEASSQNPRPKGKILSLDKGEWTLHHLIEVSTDIKLLPDGRSQAIDQILRDYRNFVHPKVEIRTGYPCTEAEALLAKGALDSVCNHLETSFP